MPWVAHQPGLQPDDGVEVEVVGGLVEQQHVGAAEQGARQVQAHAPATGELGDGAALVGGLEAEAVQQLGGARGRSVAIDARTASRAGAAMRAPSWAASAAASAASSRAARCRRRARSRARCARWPASPGRRWRGRVARGSATLPASGAISPVIEAEQAGLARAVAADDAHAPAGIGGKVDARKQRARPAGQGYIGEGQHVAGKAMPGAMTRAGHQSRQSCA